MIRACIFDLGGTIVDKYSMTPFLSFKNAFQKQKINIPDRIIYNSMGKDKKEHIQSILDDSKVQREWITKYNSYPTKNDVDHIYYLFNQSQIKNTKIINIIPETYNCINYLRNNNISTGCTTGFNREIMHNIKNFLLVNNLNLNNYVSSTCIKKQDGSFYTRPSPGMIYKNITDLNLSSNDKIIKVDDTNIGIEEGKNAGCITVGVARWSINMKFTPSTLRNINDDIFESKLKESRKILNESNPDYIIDTLDELPHIIREINKV